MEALLLDVVNAFREHGAEHPIIIVATLVDLSRTPGCGLLRHLFSTLDARFSPDNVDKSKVFPASAGCRR